MTAKEVLHRIQTHHGWYVTEREGKMISEVVELARLLLTPNARMSDTDDGLARSTIEWEKARIRWHRLDGNDVLADKLLEEINAFNRALGKDEVVERENHASRDLW